MRDNDEMARIKINTLEMEIKQQNEFASKEETNYENQIKMLQGELKEIRGTEVNWQGDFDNLISKNAELQSINARTKAQVAELEGHLAEM